MASAACGGMNRDDEDDGDHVSLTRVQLLPAISPWRLRNNCAEKQVTPKPEVSSRSDRLEGFGVVL